MSCGEGKPCREVRHRRIALVVLALMAGIFLALSIFSFLPSRNQVTPDTVRFGSNEAVAGKRVFQAYNCMGCHTMVGNGAYFGPDLTNIYEHAGPAWLAAFLPSAGTWPTPAAVRIQFSSPDQVGEKGMESLDAYYAAYPGAKDRMQRRGGGHTIMPNLPLRGEEVGQLIAYLKYTASMNTEGWPPKPKVDGMTFPQASPGMNVISVATAASAATPAAAAASETVVTNPVVRGAQLAKEFACNSCHAIDETKLVGPGWGGLYDSQVSLADGTTVQADDAYLTESIRKPNAQIVSGYVEGTMPAYEAVLSDDDVNAIVAYIRSLKGNGQ